MVVCSFMVFLSFPEIQARFELLPCSCSSFRFLGVKSLRRKKGQLSARTDEVGHFKNRGIVEQRRAAAPSLPDDRQQFGVHRPLKECHAAEDESRLGFVDERGWDEWKVMCQAGVLFHLRVRKDASGIASYTEIHMKIALWPRLTDSPQPSVSFAPAQCGFPRGQQNRLPN